LKIVVIIPARLNSSRLPGKVLLDIASKPMVQHVYEAAKKAKNIAEVYIATDSKEVQEVCLGFTQNVLMTDASHESGTDRLAEAVQSIECDGVINVQGDEPLIDPNLIDALSQELQEGYAMVSAMHRIETTKELASPNAVKVVVNNKSEALYFSRSIIPHHRDEWESLIKHHKTVPQPLNFFKHIGIYGYTKEFLQNYAQLEQTYLEKLEKLEQLRVLENGHTIKMIQTSYIPVGVDVQEDLEEVRKIFGNKTVAKI